ncbi:glycosyltransferase family 4 protein [Pseudomonas sp. PDM16]|uniref:glycosyltransferase family 4 protein n=1 Tax=Pseudomonas sp. PDM16 TaxID=2769292 RepID=UPI00177C6CFA|nr:glycosyltransferase family 4 protein [Pseudomonas sp. PDM16]MBD9415045.1 glycosyltransferase family 4 protein [Pseudomonas sp. PDM16]
MTLRVLHVSKEFEPLSSGVARHIQGLANAMRDSEAVEPILLAPQVDAVGTPGDIRQGGYGSLWKAIGESDLVHVHGARTPFAAAAAFLAWLRGAPVVYTPHCYYDAGGPGRRALKRFWDLTVERFLMRASGVVVLLHEGWIADLAGRGLHPARVLIVPNCIDDRREAEAVAVERLDGLPALLSIGRLDPVKRLDDVIAALSAPSLERAVFHIVGRGEDRSRLEGLAERSGVAGRVRFHGWQDDTASARMMAGCDAMVLASEREGMPTVVLEALLARVPIACSDIEGCRSITREVGWNLTFPVGDVPALGSCLSHAARSNVSDEVVEAVKAGFTWQRKVQELIATYRELAVPARRQEVS